MIDIVCRTVSLTMTLSDL